MTRTGDFTKRERDIREALFAVFYEEHWYLEYRKPFSEKAIDEERWKFVDKVIDTLRKDDAKRRRGTKKSA
jgi:hypothetical protein